MNVSDDIWYDRDGIAMVSLDGKDYALSFVREAVGNYVRPATVPPAGAHSGVAMGHKWRKSKLGHGTLQCEYCLATEAELAALGELDRCPATLAPKEPTNG